MKRSDIWILLINVTIYTLVIYAIQAADWWLNEMSGDFLLIGIVAITISRPPLTEAVKAFVKGIGEMVVPALVVDLASGILVVHEDGKILDTIIYASASHLNDAPKSIGGEGMLIFQTILNLFIPSGSNQAAVTMLLMAPLP